MNLKSLNLLDNIGYARLISIFSLEVIDYDFIQQKDLIQIFFFLRFEKLLFHLTNKRINYMLNNLPRIKIFNPFHDTLAPAFTVPNS